MKKNSNKNLGSGSPVVWFLLGIIAAAIGVYFLGIVAFALIILAYFFGYSHGRNSR